MNLKELYKLQIVNARVKVYVLPIAIIPSDSKQFIMYTAFEVYFYALMVFDKFNTNPKAGVEHKLFLYILTYNFHV